MTIVGKGPLGEAVIEVQDSPGHRHVYVMPSTPGDPPRAQVMSCDEVSEVLSGARSMGDAGDIASYEESVVPGGGTRSCWTVDGFPVVAELDESITEHARNLGVDL